MANLVDSYSESNQDTSDIYNGDSGVVAIGQSFTGDGNVLDSCVFYLKKQSSPGGTFRAKIYAHTGTFGSGGTPTGSPLATSDDINASSLTTSFQLITFTFSGANRITLGNGTKYFVVFDPVGVTGSSPNGVLIGLDQSSPTHGGNYAFFQTGSWNSGSFDLCFYVYSVNASSPSASLSPSSSVSPSNSPSVSSSPSPSAAPPLFFGMKVAKQGVNVLHTSDPKDLKFSSEFGTLKYFTKQTINISFDASTGDISAKGSYTHGLGYYPYVEVYVRVYTGSTPSGNYEYCPFFGAGATILYSGNVVIDTNKITVYGEISGVSGSVWHFDFLIFVFKNDLHL